MVLVWQELVAYYAKDNVLDGDAGKFTSFLFGVPSVSFFPSSNSLISLCLRRYPQISDLRSSCLVLVVNMIVIRASSVRIYAGL